MLLAIADFVDENELELHPADLNEVLGGAEGDGEEALHGSQVATGKQLKLQALAGAVRDMNRVVRSDLIPYLIKCFERLFPAPTASAVVLQESYFDKIMQEGGLLQDNGSFSAASSPDKPSSVSTN